MTSSHPAKPRHEIEDDLARARQNNDAAAEAACLMVLGDIAKAEKEYALAQGLYGQAWALYRHIGNLRDEAFVLLALQSLVAEIWNHTGREPFFISEMLEATALAIYEQLSDIGGQANVWANRGYNITYADGERDIPTGNNALKKALSLYEDLDDQVGQAGVYAAFGFLEKDTPEGSDKAQALYEKALALYGEESESWGKASVLYSLGKLTSKSKDMVTALNYFKTSLAMYEQFQMPIGREDIFGERYEEIAQILSDLGDYEQACLYLNKVLSIYYPAVWRRKEVGRVLWTLGDIMQKTRNYPAAQQYLEQAFQFFDGDWDFSERIKALMQLAKLKFEAGDYSGSRHFHTKAFELNNIHHDSTTRPYLLWEWGQFEYQMGDYQKGCELCQDGIRLIHFQRFDNKNEILKQWEQTLAAMNCSTSPSTETPHHD